MKVILLYLLPYFFYLKNILGMSGHALSHSVKKRSTVLCSGLSPFQGIFIFSNLPTARNCRPSVRNFATLAKTMIEGYPSVFELRQNFHWNYNFENKDSKLFPCQACQRASYIFVEIPKTRFSRIIYNLRTAPGL